MSTAAVFPGSFDPVTNGHLNIIERASKIFEKLYVLIAINPLKEYMFSTEDRLAFLTDCTKNISNVEVIVWNGLTTDFAVKNNARVIIRGIRNCDDFLWESELAEQYKKLCSSIEIVFIKSDKECANISSTKIKEMIYNRQDTSLLVPGQVSIALAKLYKAKSVDLKC